MINACVEFDERTLKPTYRLLTGLAGASSGIEIARRFGLPAGITDLAARKVLTASAEAAEYLRRLKEQYDEQRQTTAALEDERTAVAEKYARLELDFAQRDREREKEFRAELRKIVDDFTGRAEKMVAGIQDAAEERRVRKEVERRTVELKTMASTASRVIHQKYVAPPVSGEVVPETVEPEPERRELQIGDRVRLLALDQDGIVESVGSQEIVVQVGALRFREKRDDLRLIGGRVDSPRSNKAAVGLPKGVSVSLRDAPPLSSELNIIGKTVDEAVHAADKFLDAAYLDNYDRLRIVHGLGMGALKRAIAELLSTHPHVGKFYPADSAEGGQGATIVELKK